jgi:hypothetical protein
MTVARTIKSHRLCRSLAGNDEVDTTIEQTWALAWGIDDRFLMDIEACDQNGDAGVAQAARMSKYSGLNSRRLSAVEAIRLRAPRRNTIAPTCRTSHVVVMDRRHKY